MPNTLFLIDFGLCSIEREVNAIHFLKSKFAITPYIIIEPNFII